MGMVLRKIEVVDLATVEKLVIDNVEAIESGLSVIDSRLLLGHSTIDLVAQDAAGSLVLVALGLRADEGMLLRVVDAYSWCLEYSDSVRRHYPTLEVSEDRPPRIMFLIERAPESFYRKIKQLNFPAIDLIEFRHIDVEGQPAAYFETVARIRRAVLGVETPVEVAPLPRPIPARGPVNGTSRPNGHAPAAPRRVEMPIAVTSPVAIAAPVAVAAPVVVAPRIAVAAASAVAVPLQVAVPVTDVTPVPARVEPVAAPTLSLVSHAVAVEAPAAAPQVRPEAPRVTAAPEAPAAAPVAVVVAPAQVSEECLSAEATAEADSAVTVLVEEAPVDAAERETADAADASNKYLFAEAAKAAEIAREFGIQIPKDGALTRQWVDFLNQLAAK